MQCPMCGTIGLLPEQFRSCKTCRHGIHPTLPNWAGTVNCQHPRVVICYPDEDFCCSGWEAKR